MRTATLLFTCSALALVPAFALSPKAGAISQPRTMLSSRPVATLRQQRAVTMAATLEASGASQGGGGTGVKSGAP